MDSESSETDLVIITNRDRVKLFCKLYWKNLVFFITPCILCPITFINDNDAYKCFFIFLITIVYLIADIIHPSITLLVPLGLYSIVDIEEEENVSQAYIKNELLDCLAVMMIVIAVEYSTVNRRVAVKVLLTVGCSHYRLSFLLFFTTMFLSMWVSDIIACGFMMPLVNAILTEMEKMGILEVYQTIGKAKQKSERHEQSYPRPTDYTIFYFLGIAYSSSIGAMASIIGSHANQIFKSYCELLFPESPKIEFPHFMLLNLPGVLLMETLLYMWMNSYFMGMFRSFTIIIQEMSKTFKMALCWLSLIFQKLCSLMRRIMAGFNKFIHGDFPIYKEHRNATTTAANVASPQPSVNPTHSQVHDNRCRAQSRMATEIGVSEEEAQYIKELLIRQDKFMGKIRFHETIVGFIVIVTGMLQVIMNSVYIGHWNQYHSHSHIKPSAPCIVSVILLFVTPINLDFFKFFEKRTDDNTQPLPQFPSKACLNWSLVRKNMDWSVLFTIVLFS